MRNLPAKKGFTLIEVLFALAILAVTLCGLLLTYLNMFVLADVIRDSALAGNALTAKLEEIRHMNYSDIPLEAGPFNLSDYGFPAQQLSMGRVEVTTDFAGYTGNLTKVRMTGAYTTRNSRIVGEDRNLNGALDTGEDSNSNGRLDSTIEVVGLVGK
ncbi:MAG TPA: type II secretion system protein [Candidatus Omnitrophota bacterium]|nr:type II secretion system protein [Candidatus Omnitrophota bacterium]